MTTDATTERQSHEQAEIAVADAAYKIVSWKEGILRNVAIAIVKQGMVGAFCRAWPDEVPLSFVADHDKATIGIAYKMLFKSGLIARTGKIRKSTGAKAAGRRIEEYEITSLRLANTWLQRNQTTTIEGPQQEFPI